VSVGQKYLKILSSILPTGAVGVSLLLASAAPSAAREEPAPGASAATAGVAERLAAIREAVSLVGGTESQAPEAERAPMLAWGNWGWGFGWPNWNNWHNWNNWRNWQNWGNFWRNW